MLASTSNSKAYFVKIPDILLLNPSLHTLAPKPLVKSSNAFYTICILSSDSKRSLFTSIKVWMAFEEAWEPHFADFFV